MEQTFQPGFPPLPEPPAPASWMPIYLDIGSITAAVLRAHPEILHSNGHLSSQANGPFAWVADLTGCDERREIEIARDDERFDYHGLQIGIVRWKMK